MKMLHKLMVSIAVLLTVSACSNEDGVSIATGQFKDSNTSGISYVSGGQSGTTDLNGSFNYETGKTVTFSIGGVTLGTANGKSVITPVDLIPNGRSSSIEVLNITRFLLMLDADGDPSNGIHIPAEVQTVANDWTQVNFGMTDISTGLTTIISNAISASGGVHALPNASTAQGHLETTLLCSYAGAYTGTYSGGDNGNFGFLVNAATGNIEGAAYSIPEKEYINLTGTTPISYDQNVAFVSGDASKDATFSGAFSSVNEVAGTWENTTLSINGDFSGARIGGVVNALHRFTGNYIGGDFGLFSFDIDDSNAVTGIAYSIADAEMFTLSGSVTGTTLTASITGGATITGTLNTETGALDGTWNNSAENLSGTFSGNGCQLN